MKKAFYTALIFLIIISISYGQEVDFKTVPDSSWDHGEMKELKVNLIDGVDSGVVTVKRSLNVWAQVKPEDRIREYDSYIKFDPSKIWAPNAADYDSTPTRFWVKSSGSWDFDSAFNDTSKLVDESQSWTNDEWIGDCVRCGTCVSLFEILDNGTDWIKIFDSDTCDDSTYKIIEHDGLGVAVHPDVFYDPDGWPDNGTYSYKYWMVFTGVFGVGPVEDPQILACNDGRTWRFPDGTNYVLVDSCERPEHYSDPDLFLWNDTLWCVWRWTAGSCNKLLVTSSIDGINWSADIDTILSGRSRDHSFDSPSWVIDHNGKIRIYHKGKGYNLVYRTSDRPNGTYSETTGCILVNLPRNSVWNINVEKYQDEYHLLVTSGAASNPTYTAYFCTSPYGDSFYCHPDRIPLIAKGDSGQWDDNIIYRLTGFPIMENGEWKYLLWYSANAGSSMWHIGYTEAYTNIKSTPISFNWWGVNDAEDSITVHRGVWHDYKNFGVIEFLNESSTDNQYDTIIAVNSVKFENPVNCIFDSSCVRLDSFNYRFQTSSTSASVTSIEFIIFRQDSANADTSRIYGSDTRAGGAANTWETVSIPRDSLGTVLETDILSVWTIVNTDAGHTIKVDPEQTKLFYSKED